jgi:hypothetical protein
MSEIAFNMNGEPFDPPPTMAAWRVRKLKPKGAPEVVYGRDGLPLFLPFDADIEDLRREAPAPADGRYRLDPVDDHNRSVPNAQSSYVCVHAVVREREAEPAAPTASAASAAAALQADTTTQLVQALLESQKQHTELARMYVAQFPVLVNALSGVVRSAGDAGLPARVPLVVPIAPEVKPAEPPAGTSDDESDDEEHDEDDEEDVEVIEIPPEPEWSWPRLAATALERFSPQINVLLGQLPTLGASLGARRAQHAQAEAAAPTSGAPAADVGAHLAAIRNALPPSEAAEAVALIDELPMTDKLTYVQTLREMSVPEAVGYVRRELTTLARNRARGAAAPVRDEDPAPRIAMSEAEIDAHIDAIRAAMTPEESEVIRVMFEELVFEHRLIWVEQLCARSVPEGVIFLREKLAEAQRDAQARGTAEPRIVRTPSTASTAAPDAAPIRPAAPRPSASDKPRRAGRRVAGSRVPSESSPTTSTAPTGDAPTAGLVSPARQAQIAAIQIALTPDEDTAVRAYLAALPQAERSAWITRLLALPVPEAVEQIRAQLARAVRPDAATTTAIAAPQTTAPAARNRVVPAAPSAEGTAPRDERDAGISVLDSAAPPAPDVPDDASIPAEAKAAGSAVHTAPHLAPPATVESIHAPPTAPLPTTAPSETTAPPSAEINADAHLLAIEHALTAGERFQVHAMVAQMSPDTREILLDQLLSVQVPQGAAILRAAIQDLPAGQMPPVESGAVTVPSAAAQFVPRSDDEQTLDMPAIAALEADSHDEADDHDETDDHDEADDEVGDENEAGDDDEAGDHDEAGDDDETDETDNHDEADGRAADEPTTPSAPAAVSSASMPTLTPEASAHFKNIESALTFAERMRVYELGARLSAAELRGWIAELTALPVPEAVAKVRAALAATDRAASTTKTGGAS